jgi:hypothetical protein
MLVEDGVTVTVGVMFAVPPVAVPLSKIVWVALGTLRLLSVSTRDPLRLPAVVGAKLIDRVQNAPAASEPADEAELPVNGQAVPPELFKVKFVEILGLFPLDGIGNVSAVFPLFHSVTVCGLSLLVEPTVVDAKPRLGVSAKSSFTTPFPFWLPAPSATNTFPLASTATPRGSIKPVANVLTVV